MKPRSSELTSALAATGDSSLPAQSNGSLMRALLASKAACMNLALGRHISKNPFSTMALCNIAGDMCYLGFACHSAQGLSLVKLAGALSAMAGHLILLACGDLALDKASEETGFAANAVTKLRRAAQQMIQFVTKDKPLAKPIFWAFAILGINGATLAFEAGGRLQSSLALSTLSQFFLGLSITLGCSLFAAADLVRSQRAANILTKLAPSVFSIASICNAVLGISTLNPFMLASMVFFTVANLSGFFTKIEKPIAV